MSVYAGIVNPKKVLRSTVTTPPTLSGCTNLYVTVPWPSYSTIENIIVSANENFSDLILSVLSNGAAYRAASTDDAQQYILSQEIQDSGSVQWYKFSPNTLTVDAYRAGYTYLNLNSSMAMTTGTIFQITVEGYARIPSELEGIDYAPYKNDKNFRALKLTSGDTRATDLTAMLAWNGPPTESGDAPICFNSTNDTMYFGSDKSFSALEFQIYSGAQTTGQFTWQYYRADTATWTTFTPVDNTSDGQATPGEFNYSGTFALPSLTGWGPAQLSTDPMKIMIDEIIAGTRLPMGMSYNPSRYWIRATPTVLNGTLKLGFARTLNV